MSRSIKTLIHVHTDYSFDSDVSLERLTAFAQAENFGCIVVTDHDTIAGAKKLASMKQIRVIVGEEVTTRQGHLIGLFLREAVRPGMSARETALAIREQGGLVLLPHPFVAAFGCGLRRAAYEIVDLVDAVEVNNAQNLFPWPDLAARRFAERFQLPMYCGSDSHSRASLAPCYQVMPDFDGTPRGFLNSLRAAELHVARHPLAYFAAAAARVARYFLRLPLPLGFGTHAAGAATLSCDTASLPLAA